MPIDIKSKFIDSEMATDIEVNAASVEDRKRSNHTGTQLASTISDFTTAVQAVTIDAAKIDGGVVSNAEFATLDGINTGSTIQAQINGKQDTITGAASSVTSIDLTPSRVVTSGVSGKITNSSVSTTTLGFLDATSSIQTQLNGKQATGNYITALTGDVTASGPGPATATLANSGVSAGTYNQVTVDAKGRVTTGTVTQWSHKTTVTQTSTTAAFAATNELVSTTLQPGLYKFDCIGLAQTAAATTGIGFRIGAGTATLSNVYSRWYIDQAADGTAKSYQYAQLAQNTNITSTAALTANTNFIFEGSGVFRVSVAGTVRIEFRTEVAASAAILQPDSSFTITAL